ncbi:bifunctional molybdopterin-guanine dinucleotide biosynthesis adaptor protein MobB/molybdopterin molybdotransferase MoeA [Niveispirillum irakense]|uniref:bifunctional molybdopterin-guanine dinucleotide biosynthesis adaptor protein MobB/molybdopterin molybdotransferase MoeA n=1 Tax=Niveispirillum irakense TaxID=34011 RepID=UPI000406169B|nr:bifunctional molybdopterin-guanine dinucleotide biosynthesis adaptor protein MobB/molybdopterin molybdotransferase MoeA [Niveispirillum irakense]
MTLPTNLFGLAGWSGSGKTTLMARLIPALAARGYSVATLKHAHHAFDIDQPGKDSYVHRMAGAVEVLVASGQRWALMHENRGEPEPALADLVAKLSPVDLILVEGFKRDRHPKLEVHRPDNGKARLYPDDPHIIAVASDVALPDCPLPVLDLDDADAIAALILHRCGLSPRKGEGTTRLALADCAAGQGLLRLDAAVERLQSSFAPVASMERVPVGQAVGRVLATDLVAERPFPGFDNSAVDGYALRAADLMPDAWTRLVPSLRIAAGDAPTSLLPPGGAARIFTGAPLPPGADLVVMQEDVRLEDGAVLVPPGLSLWQNCRRRGEDVAVGRVTLPAGRRLDPGDIALAVALGASSLPVRRPLRVALFSTGNELTDIGADIQAGRLTDSNRPMLAALLAGAGCVVSDLGILADDQAGLERALAAALPDHDLIVTSGGMSVGEEDHVRAALLALGGSLDFWKLAIKPGKPLALGHIGQVAFCGLPGNPAASFVTFHLMVRPLLARLSGAALEPPLRLPIRSGFAHGKKEGRREFLRVRLEQGEGGVPVAMPAGAGPGAALSSLAGCDGLLDLAEEATALAPGDSAMFLPLRL